MNKRMIAFVIGRILLTEAALLVIPLAVALLCGESPAPFLLPIALLVLLGGLMSFRRPRSTSLFARDGLAVVALAWIAMSAFGALPFYVSGEIPSYVDCFFETVSGFTTTGASILPEVESLSKSILFWRSFTHWVGGMGVLVFVMAVLPMTDGHGMHLLRAEVPGPTVGKLVSRMGDSAKILYGIYLVMTIVEIILLLLGGMPLFDACINSFGSAGTGGFSCRNLSIGAYNNAYYDVVIGIFMLLFGVNFNLYYMMLIKRIGGALKSRELWCYLAIVITEGTVIAFNIRGMYSGTEETVRASFFQVASVITTTGYSTADFNMWPDLSKGILFILMFIGGCAGSTAGGLKVSRVMMLFKSAGRELKKVLHPRTVSTVHFEGKPLDESTLGSANAYFALYMICLGVIFLLLSFEPKGLETNLSAAVSCFNNIGPGLGAVGPAATYAGYSVFSKLVLSFAMLLGRLEIYPLLLALMPSTWTKK